LATFILAQHLAATLVRCQPRLGQGQLLEAAAAVLEAMRPTLAAMAL
jgi:hypothetical protein